MSCAHRLLLLVLVSLPLTLTAADFDQQRASETNPEDSEESYYARIREKAGEFKRVHAALVADAAANAEAKVLLDSVNSEEAAAKIDADADPAHSRRPWWAYFGSRTRWEQAVVHYRTARSLAKQGFHDYPHTPSGPNFLHTSLIAQAALGDIAETRESLITLWEYFPDYTDIAKAMATALQAAEAAQAFSKSVHLDAEDPSQVVELVGSSYIDEDNRLFQFLARNGDRATIAPRATIGIARAWLLTNHKDNFHIARASYEQFLERYPDHELTFTALCELALCYLQAYRGNHYDVGALFSAASQIDQAELETRGIPENIALVQAYRKRIRTWHQDRDLEVARWYRDRKRPAWLIWLKDPSDASWDEAARHYYQQVIDRDTSSEFARVAERELAKLPKPQPSPLGASIPTGPAPLGAPSK